MARLGKCDCCGHRGTVSTFHPMGTLQVCDTCKREAEQATTTPHGWCSLDGLSLADMSHEEALAMADEVWDRR
jgi:hypothetical protein